MEGFRNAQVNYFTILNNKHQDNACKPCHIIDAKILETLKLMVKQLNVKINKKRGF
jgi:hypothetical protein